MGESIGYDEVGIMQRKEIRREGSVLNGFLCCLLKREEKMEGRVIIMNG